MEAVCSPFSFEAAHGMLRCHGESIAVPHAEGCTQWLLLVCRRAAYAVRPVLPFGLTLQRCCVVCSALGRFVIPSWNIVPVLVQPSLALPFEPRLNGWVRLPLQLRYVPC